MPVKTGFDPKVINDFQKAILARDTAGVWNALEAGVDPSTPMTLGGLHPLQALLVPYKTYTSSMAKLGLEVTVKNQDEYNERVSEIVDTLMTHGVKLVEEEKFVEPGINYLMDKILLSSSQVYDTSTLMLHAIKQSLEDKGEAYVPDPYDIAMACAVAYKSGDGIPKGLNALENIHKIVRQRLEDPSSEVELDIIRNHKDKIDYWLQPFERPSLDQIQQYFDELNDMGEEMQAQSKGIDKESGMGQFIHKLGKDGKQPEQILEDIDGMIGMPTAKRNARRIQRRAKLDAARADYGFEPQPQSQHTVFTGPPGTGKTTLARHRAELLHSLGLAGDTYVEISRENLVGKYIGHTEATIVELINNADIIFIDEAYNLVNDKDDKKDFGNRVVEALMTALENKRDNLTVFFAGYPDQMKEFLDSNPGLASRIGYYESLEAPTMDELGLIMDGMVAKSGYTMETEAREYALAQLEAMKKGMNPRDFGNARIVRTMVEQLPNALADRLDEEDSHIEGASKSAVSTITKADVEALNMGVAIAGTSERKTIGFDPKRISQPAMSKR
jgi:AAA+ superfamily predicted ATPase